LAFELKYSKKCGSRGEGVCWKDRVYDISEEDKLNLVKDNSN